jgi:hypothetical protein
MSVPSNATSLPDNKRTTQEQIKQKQQTSMTNKTNTL